MGQIKNIKLHIVTDIKELLLSELQLTMEDASNKAQIIEKVSNHVEEVERVNIKSGERFACKLCGKEFWIQSILKDHYTDLHAWRLCKATSKHTLFQSLTSALFATSTFEGFHLSRTIRNM